MTATLPGIPTDLDVLASRIPEATPRLDGLTDDWHLWRHWADGMWPAMVRHLDGTPGDPDARYVAIVPFAFTWAVITGPYRWAGTVYEDRWCYHTRLAALAAAHTWDGQGEPVGWHRHPTTDRRTIDGDMSRIFTDRDGCSVCGAQLFEHRCQHRPPCCPDRCTGPS